MKDHNQRGHYRIEYPPRARPSLVTNDGTLEVIDCSESGLPYVLPEEVPRPEIGGEVRGVVRFRTGDEVEVDCVIARVQGRTVAVRLLGTKIPFSTVLKEQHYLRRHYLSGLNE